MSRLAHLLPGAALIAIAVCLPSTAAAQTKVPNYVRVMINAERVMRWLGPRTDVIMVVDQGTTLEVLDFDSDADSYWVVLPPDLHGTRKVGWIRAIAVEPYVAQQAAQVVPSGGPSEAPRNDAQAQALVTPPPSATGAAEDGVSLTVGRVAAASIPAEPTGVKNSYAFEDVHFERGRFSIRNEDLDRLRAAAAALKEDPSLVMTIEGHTCSLGPGPYNVALGNRRANAVKEFLVSTGVPAERLFTVSQGETHAEHDNSREETRRLNRRVALVPKVPR